MTILQGDIAKITVCVTNAHAMCLVVLFSGCGLSLKIKQISSSKFTIADCHTRKHAILTTILSC